VLQNFNNLVTENQEACMRSIVANAGVIPIALHRNAQRIDTSWPAIDGLWQGGASCRWPPIIRELAENLDSAPPD